MYIDTPSSTEPRASAFVTARLAGRSIAEYPGALPIDLEEAYLIQDHAIALWPDVISGWKVGRINEPHAGLLGADRLVGPIFRRSVRPASPGGVDMEGFAGGFAAVEGEYVFVVGRDAPRDKTRYDLDDARDFVGSVRAGIEIASSPFPSINDLGPLVTISDFGNNHGLIIGAEIEGWQAFNLSRWTVETVIDGALAGRGAAADIPGGPLESFRHCLENCARRGHFLAEGALISTGAVSGVHRIDVGGSAVVSFAGAASIACRITPAAPL